MMSFDGRKRLILELAKMLLVRDTRIGDASSPPVMLSKDCMWHARCGEDRNMQVLGIVWMSCIR